MRSEIRRKIMMADRVREFCQANPSEEEGHQGAVTRLEERLTRATALGVLQRTGTGDVRNASARRRQTRQQIEFALLNPLVKVGRAVARTTPELVGKFALSHHHSTHKAFLIGARAMLAQATAAKEVLVKKGLAARLLDDLATALDRFEEESNAINLSRRAHIGARAELNEVASALTELVDILDGFNRFRFQANPEQLAVWTAARSVVAHRPRRSSAPPADSPGPAPTGGSTQAA